MKYQYVVGFVFDVSMSNVLLIRKRRPEWQAGLLNGCGGKIAPGESDLSAMERECLEETNLHIPENEWTRCVDLYGGHPDHDGYRVAFFFASADLTNARTMTDEEFLVVPLRHLARYSTTMHVQWIVPLCLAFVQSYNGRKISESLTVKEA